MTFEIRHGGPTRWGGSVQKKLSSLSQKPADFENLLHHFCPQSMPHPRARLSAADRGFEQDRRSFFLSLPVDGKLGENSDANTGLRSPCPNFHPKNVWMKIRIHFGDGFSGSSEEGCFSSSFAFLPFGFGFFCSSPDSCFSCLSSLRRLFSASMIWILSRRRVSSSAAAFRCFEVISGSRCAYDHLSAVVTSFIKGSMSTRPLFWGSS